MFWMRSNFKILEWATYIKTHSWYVMCFEFGGSWGKFLAVQSLSKTTKLILLDSLLQEVCIMSGFDWSLTLSSLGLSVCLSQSQTSLFRAKESLLNSWEITVNELWKTREAPQTWNIFSHWSQVLTVKPKIWNRSNLMKSGFENDEMAIYLEGIGFFYKVLTHKQ